MAINTGEIELVVSAESKGIKTTNTRLLTLIKRLKDATKEADALKKSLGASFSNAAKAADQLAAAQKRVNKSAPVAAQQRVAQSAQGAGRAWERQRRVLNSTTQRYRDLRAELNQTIDNSRRVGILDRQFARFNQRMQSGVLPMRDFNQQQIRMNNLMRGLSRSARQARGDISPFNRNIREAVSASVLALGPLSQVGARIQALGSIATRTGNILLTTLIVGLTGLGTTLGIVSVMAVRARLEHERFLAVLSAGGQTLEQAQQQLDDIIEVSNRLGLDFRSLAGEFAKLRAAAEPAGMTLQQTTQIFEGFATAAAALRLTGDQVAGVFRAVQQIISKGTVQAEELRGQLGERLPGAFGLAATAIGVTTEELNKMLKAGEVTAEDLLPRLSRLLEVTFGEAARNNVESLQGKINLLRNAMFEFLIEFDKASGVSEAFGEALDAVRRSLVSLRENMKLLVGSVAGVIGVITGLIAVFVGRGLVGAIGSVITRLIRFRAVLDSIKAANYGAAFLALGGPLGALISILTVLGTTLGAVIFSMNRFKEASEVAIIGARENASAIEKLNKALKDSNDFMSEGVRVAQDQIETRKALTENALENARKRIESIKEERQEIKETLELTREQQRIRFPTKPPVATRNTEDARQKTQELAQEQEELRQQVIGLVEEVGNLDEALARVEPAQKLTAAMQVLDTEFAAFENNLKRNRMLLAAESIAIQNLAAETEALTIATNEYNAAREAAYAQGLRNDVTAINEAGRATTEMTLRQAALAIATNEVGAAFAEAFDKLIAEDELRRSALALVTLDNQMHEAMDTADELRRAEILENLIGADALVGAANQINELKKTLDNAVRAGFLPASRATSILRNQLRGFIETAKEDFGEGFLAELRRLAEFNPELAKTLALFERIGAAADTANLDNMFETTLASLQRQTALMGETTHLQELNFRLNEGNLRKLQEQAPAQAEILREAARILDAKQREFDLEQERQRLNQRTLESARETAAELRKEIFIGELRNEQERIAYALSRGRLATLREIDPELAGQLETLALLKDIEDKRKQQAKELQQFYDRVGQEIANSFTQAVIGAQSFEGALASLLTRLAEMIIKMFIADQLAKSIGSALGSMGGSSFSASESVRTVDTSGITAGLAKGGAFSHGRLTKMASGGLVTSPTLFPMANGGTALAGEAGTEGILPLERIGGKLGVNASGSGETKVEVNIIDQRKSGEDVQVESQKGPDGRTQIKVLVRDTINELGEKGQLDNMMKRNFGVKRQARR